MAPNDVASLELRLPIVGRLDGENKTAGKHIRIPSNFSLKYCFESSPLEQTADLLLLRIGHLVRIGARVVLVDNLREENILSFIRT